MCDTEFQKKFFFHIKIGHSTPQLRYSGAESELHQNSIVFFEVSVNELDPTLQKREADGAYLDGNTGCMS